MEKLSYQELKEIFELMKESGLKPIMCDTPVPYFDADLPQVANLVGTGRCTGERTAVRWLFAHSKPHSRETEEMKTPPKLPKTPKNSHEIGAFSGKTPIKGNFSTSNSPKLYADGKSYFHRFFYAQLCIVGREQNPTGDALWHFASSILVKDNQRGVMKKWIFY